MAYSGSVWGIDIGQCGLKALRGRVGDEGSVQVDAFEYIEYPKLLSQQDAEPDELIREAITTFLSRNSLRGDKVALSVSGQSGLTRFIKLPPVDEKKLPDLVGYEAKQQIPFALEDVVWDYQRLPTTDDEDDLPQTEVGLFAMKRDQVMRLIKPLVDMDIEIDVVQLMPICAFNAVVHDRRLSPDEDETFDPNTWHVIFAMGTETSDLVLTNGARVWQRSIPIGGNHFTKQLTTDLKLTFAKAEHTKRNAREAADPRKIFQSMRPVFNDLVTELQRTLGYFRGIEKNCEIDQLIVLGNSLKLPGLAQYLEKNLELKVYRPDHFARLSGSHVTDDPRFKEHLLAFPAAYGLVLQGLRMSALQTNLIPREILRQRMIRAKKPWVAAIAAALLAAFAFNFFFHWRAWNIVHPDDWTAAKQSVNQVQQRSTQLIQDDAAKLDELKRLNGLGRAAVGSADGRLLWLELLKAITASLPVDPTLGDTIPSLEERPLNQRKEIFIDRIETEYFPDISQWFTDDVRMKYDEMQQNRQVAAERAAHAAPSETEPNENDAAAVDEPVVDAESAAEPATVEAMPMEGGAWVIQITGHHFQHQSKPSVGSQYLRENLLDQLEFGTVELPLSDGTTETFTVKELGIMNPVLIHDELDPNFQIANPKYKGNAKGPGSNLFTSEGDGGFPRPQPAGRNDDKPKEKPTLNFPRFEFTVQFAWKQTPLRERLEQRLEQSASEEGMDVAAVDGGIR